MEEVAVTFRNLLARFGDADDPALWTRPVDGLLAAHLDSNYYPDRNFLGADDAASAVAAILELARDLQSSPARASRLELVFFDGEEAFGHNISPSDGLYGSKAYAARWRGAEPANKPSIGIVLDMIGHRDLKIRFPADTAPHLEKALLAAATAEGAADRFSRALTPIIDDHVPLNDAGVPTVNIIGDFSQFAWWHTTDDDLSLISEESLAISLRVTRRLLDSLLAEGTPPN
jgi:Zn-dependent M28 family amino/carboxypeptidase